MPFDATGSNRHADRLASETDATGPDGPDGRAGPDGPAGPAGPNGAVGPAGPVDAAGAADSARKGRSAAADGVHNPADGRAMHDASTGHAGASGTNGHDGKPAHHRDGVRVGALAAHVAKDVVEVFEAEKRLVWRLLAHLIDDEAKLEHAFANAFIALAESARHHAAPAPDQPDTDTDATFDANGDATNDASALTPPNAADGPRRAPGSDGAADRYPYSQRRRGLTTALYRAALIHAGVQDAPPADTDAGASSAASDRTAHLASSTTPPPSGDDSPAASSRERLCACLSGALEQIPLARRTPFLLSRLLRLSFADIATILDTDPACVRRAVASAHRVLADRLAEAGVLTDDVAPRSVSPGTNHSSRAADGPTSEEARQ